MGGVDNKTSRELTHGRYKAKMHGTSFYKGCYEEYLESGAQFRMTYASFKKGWAKKKRRLKRSKKS
jgi:hypothetical protein